MNPWTGKKQPRADWVPVLNLETKITRRGWTVTHTPRGRKDRRTARLATGRYALRVTKDKGAGKLSTSGAWVLRKQEAAKVAA